MMTFGMVRCGVRSAAVRAIAVIPGGEKLAAPTADVKEPVWSHGWNVKARKFGEKDFNDRTQVFGGEVFRDDNIGAILTISDTGALSAASVGGLRRSPQ